MTDENIALRLSTCIYRMSFKFNFMRVAYQIDDSSPAPVVISSEAFLTLKRLKNEFEEVTETIEKLNTPS